MSAPGSDDIVDEADSAAPRGRVRRGDKAMSPAEVDAFLAAAFCGRTATVGPDGYPYVVPNLFIWLRGQVYLHTAKVEGHFLTNVRHADRISFEIDEAGEVFPYGSVECDTSVSYRSVIVFGRIRIIEAEAEKIEFYSTFMTKYAPPGSWGREQGSFPRLSKTIVYAITPEAITGKRGPLPALDERWPNRKPAAAAARQGIPQQAANSLAAAAPASALAAALAAAPGAALAGAPGAPALAAAPGAALAAAPASSLAAVRQSATAPIFAGGRTVADYPDPQAWSADPANG